MDINIVTPQEHIRHSIFTAIQGARLSKKSESDSTTFVMGDKDFYLAHTLSYMGISTGHDKFLQSIPFSVDITWSRYMWQEFDTYRIGVTKQSESTIHNLLSDIKNLSIAEFQHGGAECRSSDNVISYRIEAYEYFIEFTKKIYENKELTNVEKLSILKGALPEGFLQKRRVCMNYAVMKTIYLQRHNHPMPEWDLFLDYMIESLPYSSLWLPKPEGDES